MSSKIFLVLVPILLFLSCQKEDPVPENEVKLIVRLDVDPQQTRLGNIGIPADIPPGNAGQIPQFNALSAHYLELAPNATTLLGTGVVVYKAPETTAGGDNAIDFDQSKIVTPGEVFLEIPLKDIAAGSYEWVRLSLSYQNYDVQFYFDDQPFMGTIASFVGFNNYISKYQIKNEEVTVDENRLQGYWGFETVSSVVTGQAPEGATTVPNPLWDSSPIPQGSCVVTGNFDKILEITGAETEDIEVTLSLSVNNSFEWKDDNGNGRWDINVGSIEQVVDMGLRGLVPSHNQ